MQHMALKEYIEKVGPVELADKLRVSRQLIYRWSGLKGVPRPELALKMMLLSSGALSFESIYMPYLEKKLTGKKFRVGGKKAEQLEFKFAKHQF